MGNIGPVRQRYEVLPEPRVDLSELDSALIAHADEQRTHESGATVRTQPARP